MLISLVDELVDNLLKPLVESFVESGCNAPTSARRASPPRLSPPRGVAYRLAFSRFGVLTHARIFGVNADRLAFFAIYRLPTHSESTESAGGVRPIRNFRSFRPGRLLTAGQRAQTAQNGNSGSRPVVHR